MIQYIYFVKCPNCEDEPFDFFNDAKDYALRCLSQKPVITQIEVNRNDFGECVDSSDLGTIWSWEDIMKETDAEPAISVFTEDDIAVDYDADSDPEFAALDNSLDAVPDNFCKPIPDGMTIEALVEEMEENEDTVECKWCEDLFDKSECRYEVDLGWLCPRCEAAIKSRGEPLTFRENDYWDFLDESNSLQEGANRETIDLEYDDLTITVSGPKRAADDWDEIEHSGSYTLSLDKDEVATTIWENFITEEDAADVPGGLETLDDDNAWAKFLETHFDTLFAKYYKKLLKYYEEDAIEAYSDSYDWSKYQSELADERADFEYESRRDDFFESSSSMLEELESADTYSKRLQLCPECGKVSLDTNTAICINCGLDLN